MIGYDDMLARDAYSYFHNCWAFKIVDGGRRVLPYTLNMGYYVEDEENGELAHDMMYTARDRAGEELHVTGEELFCTSGWITHRFAMGYIPMGANRLVRVDAEPVSSRMLKGLLYDHCRAVPLLVTNEDQRSQRWYDYIYSVRGSLSATSLPVGIAKVLSLGTPPVMRSRVPIGEANVRARREVLAFMQAEERLVMVPEFKTALIKHRSNTKCAYILHNGAHIGMLYYDTGLHSKVLRARGSGRKVAEFIESTRKGVVTSLMCESVEMCDFCL